MKIEREVLMNQNELVWRIVKMAAIVVVLIAFATGVNTYVKTRADLEKETLKTRASSQQQTLQIQADEAIQEIRQEAATARTKERTDKWTHTFQKAVPWGEYDDEVKEDTE
jgi:ABC-type bacteriocin/lantibiotic exporter with double-glycine peptidase domain